MKQEFFAASNSVRGFVSYYREVFGDCRRIYVVKGGPGTGKSRFMADLAKGKAAKRYYCSSDPSSLDGVIIGDVAILDGTAPHVWEPRLVGACEEILNLGAFWDAARLEERRGEIEELMQAKNQAYEQAYAALRALGECETASSAQLNACIDRDKLNRAALRLLRGVKGGNGRRGIGLCRAISMTGCGYLDSYESANDVVYISEHLGSGHLLLARLEEICRSRGVDILASPSPLFPRRLDALYLPAVGKSFVLLEDGDGIPMKRFFGGGLKDERPHLRRAASLRTSLLEVALERLARARVAHFALENIYSGAMDFAKKQAYTEEIRYRLFGC